jgi:hypothetical protein
MYQDLEEIPLTAAKKSFEELLEEKLQLDTYQAPQKRVVTKNEFLRRKSNPPGEYRVSKYEEYDEKPSRAVEKVLKTSESAVKIVEQPIIPKMKKPSPSLQIDAAPRTPESSSKKTFLRRGEGKSCLSKKDSKSKPVKNSKKSNSAKQSTKPYEPQRMMNDFPVTIKESKPAKLSQVQTEESPVKKPSTITTESKIKPRADLKTEDSIYYDPSALTSDEPSLKPKPPEPKTKSEEIYNEKMSELNLQIERFKHQASLLKAENKDLKSKLSQIESEFCEFSERKEKRIQELQTLKTSELKRMKKERLELEKSLKIVETKPNTELEDLRKLLFRTQEEISIKDFKETENLEKISEELSKINSEINDLEAQVRIREQLVLKEKFSKPKQPNEKVYSNGTRVKQFPDGKKVIHFTNGDIKEAHPDGKVIYIYNEDQITETTLPDGTTICEFSNGQIEKTFINGLKEITFPDGSTQTYHK